jgi:hypothetical protein
MVESDGKPAAAIVEKALGRVTLEVLRIAQTTLAEMSTSSNTDPASQVKSTLQRDLKLSEPMATELFDAAVNATVRGFFGVASGTAWNVIKALTDGKYSVAPWRHVVDETIKRYERYAA